MTETKTPVIIIGAGGHARVVAEALYLLGSEVAGYLAPSASGNFELLGKHLGGDEVLESSRSEYATFALGLGFVNANGAQRRAQIISMAQEKLNEPIVHPHSFCSKYALFEPGVFVARGACIGPGAVLGMAAIANTGCIIDHDCKIGINTHIAIGARMGGDVTIGGNVLVGAGATILQGTTIGDDAVIGAGSLVNKDVGQGETVMGVPAREVSS